MNSGTNSSKDKFPKIVFHVGITTSLRCAGLEYEMIYSKAPFSAV